MTTKVIYDLGANTGDDIPYYLLKSDLVVAVEANPVLCKFIGQKYKSEIEQGRLVVENCVINAEGESGEVDFYIHRSNHVLSQLPPPAASEMEQFERVTLPSQTITEVVERYGTPHYVKIDIEHYDAQILRALFCAGIFPPYVSSESHSVEIFALLVAQGGYNAFKLVDGGTVSDVYANRVITCQQGRPTPISFPQHSAGPFGNDVDGDWLSGRDFMKVLALEGLGWKDIHATNQDAPSSSTSLLQYLLRYLDRKSKAKTRKLISRVKSACSWRRSARPTSATPVRDMTRITPKASQVSA
ncbi:FkbM family methyltransferase [Blastopirellula sp. JC732]|uniref:FkbM family methyltransferase n=1 Tax=Blastopirellula sediminis TaxID=2894196 RepID=A0A9X1SFJ9_9BACT|nr:FkbM family methyltransferase [Blastopirellula sediminis]MCC9608830.1 FkbM family methyltransferase [Blastopirellula sediminis]MCC9628393.1 FkbM family methyltransferase [Blastopirellula sediminis]